MRDASLEFFPKARGDAIAKQFENLLPTRLANILPC